MSACSCGGLKNTGVPASDAHFGIPTRWIWTPLYKSDGVTRNSVDPDVLIDAAFVTAKLNATDGSRWYPLPTMKNLEDIRAELVVETFNDQSKFKIRQGTRSANALFPLASPAYKGALDTLGCTEGGLFEIDECNNIRGEIESDGLLYPVRTESGSWSPTYVKTTDSTVEKVMLSFDYAQSVKDEMLRMISGTTITANLSAINGLFDCHVEAVGTPAQTSLVVDIFTDYGAVPDYKPVTGLLITDFYASDLTTASRIWNVTDALAVTLLTVVESTSVPGRYTMTYASQTVADVIRLYPKKNGFDFTEIYDGAHDLPAIV